MTQRHTAWLVWLTPSEWARWEMSWGSQGLSGEGPSCSISLTDLRAHWGFGEWEREMICIWFKKVNTILKNRWQKNKTYKLIFIQMNNCYKLKYFICNEIVNIFIFLSFATRFLSTTHSFFNLFIHSFV